MQTSRTECTQCFGFGGSRSNTHTTQHSQVQSYPAQLLWLSYNDPEVPCERRQAVSKFILETNDVALEMNTLRLKELFRVDLQQASMSGTIGINLFLLMRLIALRWRCDTQYIEDVNSVIKAIAGRAPRVKLPLLSARTCMIKQLQLGGFAGAVKWTSIEPRSMQIHRDAVQFSDCIPNVLGEQDRWQTPNVLCLEIPLGGHGTAHALLDIMGQSDKKLDEASQAVLLEKVAAQAVQWHALCGARS